MSTRESAAEARMALDLLAQKAYIFTTSRKMLTAKETFIQNLTLLQQSVWSNVRGLEK